jgi:large subunit ribosomal protein L18
MNKNKIFGTKQRPRLSVYRSNKHIYVQLIDDEKGETLVSASDLELKKEIAKDKDKFKKQEIAKKVGQVLATAALKKKIKKAVFDRGSYKFHGRIKALADGAREKGLQF